MNALWDGYENDLNKKKFFIKNIRQTMIYATIFLIVKRIYQTAKRAKQETFLIYLVKESRLACITLSKHM